VEAPRAFLDHALLQGLIAVRGKVPVVLARTVDDFNNFREIFAPYVAIAGRLLDRRSRSVCALPAGRSADLKAILLWTSMATRRPDIERLTKKEYDILLWCRTMSGPGCRTSRISRCLVSVR
jgi:hypothetical protein